MENQQVKIQNILDLANSQHRAGKFKEAARTYNYLANEFVLRSNLNEAYRIVQKAISLDPDNPDCYHNLGAILIYARKFEDAESCFRKAISINPSNAAYYCNLSIVLFETMNISEAEDILKKALSLSPDLYDIYEHLGLVYELQGRINECSELFDSFASRRFKEYIQPSGQAPQAILLIALPKSAGTYIAKAISKTFGIDTLPLKATCDDGIFPDSVIAPLAFRSMANQKVVLHNHAIASEQNLKVLDDTGIERALIHVRDPREAVLSYFYHSREGRALYRNKAIDDRYPEMNNDEKQQWLLDHYFVKQIEWIASWLHFESRHEMQPFKIKITSYDEMLALGEHGFIESICCFFDMERKEIRIPEKSNELRFRKGDQNEWREVFNAEQRDWMWDQIPAAMKDRFGWQH